MLITFLVYRSPFMRARVPGSILRCAHGKGVIDYREGPCGAQSVPCPRNLSYTLLTTRQPQDRLQEDASIFIRAAHMAIFDRERGKFFDRDSSLMIIDRHIGFRIYPDDLICALTLTSPDCSTIGSLEMGSSEDEWKLVGEWRGRRIEIRGKEGMGPETFRQCQNDESSCYIISYSSYSEWNGIRFPKRIVLVEENGSQKIALNITDVREEIVSRDIFEVSNMWKR
jgi:hypothetical protein